MSIFQNLRICMIAVSIFLSLCAFFHIGIDRLRLFLIFSGDHNRHHLILGKIVLHALIIHNLFQGLLIIHKQYLQRFRQFFSILIILFHIHHSVKPVDVQFQGRININADHRHRLKIKLPAAKDHQNKHTANGRDNTEYAGNSARPPRPGVKGVRQVGIPCFHRNQFRRLLIISRGLCQEFPGFVL